MATPVSILVDLQKLVQAMKSLLGNLSTRVLAVERSAIVSTASISLESPHAQSGLYTTVVYKRPNNTVALRSILGGWNSTTRTYTTRTETYYDTAGVNIVRTVLYTITYTPLRMVTAETITSIT